jgi:hypothetical protein
MYARITDSVKRGAFALFLATVALLGPASAQQAASDRSSYDVELIVFRHLSSEATEEVWNLELSHGERFAIPDDDGTPFDPVGPSAAAPATQTFPPLAASKMKLGAIEDTLRRSRDYRPLAHFGWTQPGYARDAAPFISIDGLVPGGSGLSGKVALSRGRYLHLTLDLAFTPPDAPNERYVLRQSRRMRSNERHYIDHPKFGVIAIITPSSG